MRSIDYSVVVPVYNSEHSLAELFERTRAVFAKLGRSFEMIFVEDCGSDQSWQVLRELSEQYPGEVIAVRLARNFGQHNATLCGFHYVHGDFVITIDDDLQVPPEEIPRLIEEQERSGAELVYGYYAEKHHGLIQNLGSWVIQKTFEVTFKAKGKGSSFRLISASLIEKVRQHRQRFVFIDGLLFWYTQYVSRTEVSHEPRRIGRSSYSMFKRLHQAADVFFNFTTLPLRWTIYLGFLISTISLGFGVTFFVRAFYYTTPPGWASLAVTIFFVGGAILMVLGIIGEYISRIFTLNNERPQFYVREVLTSHDQIIEQTKTAVR